MIHPEQFNIRFKPKDSIVFSSKIQQLNLNLSLRPPAGLKPLAQS
jgi:hypothetical protein